MAFKDFLKKIFKSEQEKPKQEIKQVKISELQEYLEKELLIIKDNENNSRKQIENNIQELISNLTNQLEVLKNIDIENKKEDQRIKLLVRENLKTYITYIERFILDIQTTKNLEQTNLKLFLEKIFNLINTLEKNSRNSYEKSTILTREPGDIKEIIKNFAKDLEKKALENKPVFEKIDIIENIKKSFREIESIKTAEKEANQIIKNIKEKQKNIQEEKNAIEKELNKLKISNEYNQELNKKSEHEKNINDFNNDILNIKEKLDLKSLSKHFHSDIKKSRLISQYLENFIQALQNDTSLEIEALIKEKQPDLEINLNEIKDRHNIISQPFPMPIQEKINSINNQIRTMDFKGFEIIQEQNTQQAKIKKFKDKIKDIEKEIINKAGSLGINII